MNLYNFLVAIFFTYYTLYTVGLFSKKNRVRIKEKNTELDNLRMKAIKTLDEQKKFLDTKNPYVKFKWSRTVVYNIIFQTVLYIIVINVYLNIFTWLNINWVLWQVILLIILFPLVVAIILGKFSLQNSDLLVFFKGGNKNGNNKRRQKSGR